MSRPQPAETLRSYPETCPKEPGRAARSRRDAPAKFLDAQNQDEWWKLLIEGLPDTAIIMLDHRGCVESWNSGAQRVMGFTVEEIHDRHFSCFYTQAEQDAGIPERLLEFAAVKGRAEAEGWRVRRGGSLFWASEVVLALRGAGASPRGFLKITRDVTELMQAQQALRRSQKRLSDSFERSPLALLWIGPDGSIQRANESWTTLCGAPADRCLKMRLSRFFGEPAVAARLLKRLGAHEVLQNVRVRILRPDRSIVHALVDADGFWEDGRMILSRWFVRDITDRARLEREVLHASEREQRRIGYDLHDDLCQQLVGIEFLSHTLAGQLASEAHPHAARAREISGLVRTAIERTRELAHGLAPVQMEARGLTDALRQLSARAKNLFGVECQFQCPKPVPSSADLDVHLYRIAQEAFNNAVKHGKASRVDIALKRQKDGLVLCVSDNGVGIAPKRPNKGMGLHVMQYRANAVGGSLAVERNRSGGTSVTCTVKDHFEKGKRRTEAGQGGASTL